VAVIVIAEMFGISGRRAEHGTLLERFGSWAGGQPGCRRYIFAATVTTQRDTMAMTDDDVFGWRRELEAIEALLERWTPPGERTDAVARFGLNRTSGLEACPHGFSSRRIALSTTGVRVLRR